MSYDDSGKDYKCCLDCDSVEDTDFFFNDFRGDGKCDLCHGEGEIDDFFRAEATRFTAKLITFGLDQTEFPDTIDCPKCNATGQCQSCGGNGRVKADFEEQEIESGENEVDTHVEEGNNYDSYRDDDDDSCGDDEEDNNSYSPSYDGNVENFPPPFKQSSDDSTGSNGSIVGIVIFSGAIIIVLIILAKIHSSKLDDTNPSAQANYNVAPQGSSTEDTAPPTPVRNDSDTGKAVTKISDSTNSPVSNLVTGENFLQKGVVYRFARSGETQYFFDGYDNHTTAIISFSLSDNPQENVFQLMEAAGNFSVFITERPPVGDYLVVSDHDVHFLVKEVSGTDNATLDTYRPGAPSMGDIVTALPKNCREETRNFTTYYITEEPYYYQDWINPDGTKCFKVVGTPTKRPFIN